MPAQTRGFLFSDLRGYSAFTERHGDRAARDLLTRYRRSVRESIAPFGGAEIRTEGDSFYVVFYSVSAAVEAGLAIQASLTSLADGEPVRAGIGVHAGEVEDDAEQGIVSSAVNIAARICAVAEPGEVLASDTVRGLTRSYLDVTFVARGRRRLKGIRDPVSVFRVERPDASRTGRPSMAPIAAAFGVVVLGAIVLGGGLALSGRLPLSGVPEASADSAASASARSVSAQGSASETASGETPSSSGAFPSGREQELLARLPDAIAETCVRADADEIPEAPPRAYQITPFPALAAVRCRVTQRVNAFFFMAAGPSAPEETVFHHAGRRGVQDQTCESGQPGLESWTFGPAAGWVLCSHDALWTYEDSSVLGRAISPDIETTMSWWRDNARFPAD